MRGAVIPPNTSSALGRYTFSTLSIDGAHSKTNDWDGVYIVITFRDGFGKNLPAGLFCVPSEDSNNVGWVIVVCILSGIDLTAYAVRTDRGNILTAVAILANLFDVHISLKFCVEHLTRNLNSCLMIKKTTDPKAVLVRQTMHDLQTATTIDSWERMLQDVDKRFDALDAAVIKSFVLRINPRHFCDFANVRELVNEDLIQEIRFSYYLGALQEIYQEKKTLAELQEMAARDISDGDMPIGLPLPSFAVSRTNMVEGENLAGITPGYTSQGYREVVPPMAVELWSKWCNIITETMHDNVRNSTKKTPDNVLTTIGSSHYFHSKDNRCTQLNHTIITSENGDSNSELVVRTWNKETAPSLREQYGRVVTMQFDKITQEMTFTCYCSTCSTGKAVCGHIFKAFQVSRDLGLIPRHWGWPKLTEPSFWHPAYMLSNYPSAPHKITIPNNSAVTSITNESREKLIYPAPAYMSMKARKTKKERIASLGELDTQIHSSSSSSRKKRGGQKYTKLGLRNKARNATKSYIQAMIVAFEEDLFNTNENLSPRANEAIAVLTNTKKKKGNKPCKYCAETGHNPKKCPYRFGPQESASKLVPGAYQVCYGWGWITYCIVLV